MSRAMITESNLTAIADAIRAKLGVDTTYTPAQMATAIGTIHGEPVNQEKTVTQNGEVTPDSGYDGLSKVTVNVPAATLVSKSIVANGSYNPASDNADGYSGVTVNVPNSYAAADEGKVVSGGALVAQTAHADVTPTTSDQTIDTTNNNSIKVKGDANLQAGNIKKDVQIFGVTGSYEGGGGGSTLITKTITENGTYNASSDNADGYSQVTVNVSGGGTAFIDEWDFTGSTPLVGVIRGYTANNPSGNVTFDSSGAVFDGTADTIEFPNVRMNGITVEVDVAAMNLSSGTHRRFIMVTGESGLIYRSTGKWAFFASSSWATDSSITDGAYFDNSTVKVVIDVNGYWHIYKDGTLVYEPDRAISLIGSASTLLRLGSTGSSINNATISGVRVYLN